MATARTSKDSSQTLNMRGSFLGTFMVVLRFVRSLVSLLGVQLGVLCVHVDLDKEMCESQEALPASVVRLAACPCLHLE
jgi:hypothetical protein